MQCETSAGHLRDATTFKYTIHPSLACVLGSQDKKHLLSA